MQFIVHLNKAVGFFLKYLELVWSNLNNKALNNSQPAQMRLPWRPNLVRGGCVREAMPANTIKIVMMGECPSLHHLSPESHCPHAIPSPRILLIFTAYEAQAQILAFCHLLIKWHWTNYFSEFQHFARLQNGDVLRFSWR